MLTANPANAATRSHRLCPHTNTHHHIYDYDSHYDFYNHYATKNRAFHDNNHIYYYDDYDHYFKAS